MADYGRLIESLSGAAASGPSEFGSLLAEAAKAVGELSRDLSEALKQRDRALGEAGRVEIAARDVVFCEAVSARARCDELETQLAHDRALGAQARQAAEERREMLERVVAEIGTVISVRRSEDPWTAICALTAEVRSLRHLYTFRINDDDSIVLPRACVAELVEALEGAWWVKAAAALSRMSDALIEGGS